MCRTHLLCDLRACKGATASQRQAGHGERLRHSELRHYNKLLSMPLQPAVA